MPLIELKPRSVSQRNYFGKIQSALSSAVVIIKDAVNYVEAETTKAKIRILRHLTRELQAELRLLRDKTRSFKAYANSSQDTFLYNQWTLIEFLFNRIKSNRYDLTNYRYYFHAKGGWDVKVYYQLTGTAINLTMGHLAVFKNGSFYDTLERKIEYAITSSVAGLASWQGSTIVYGVPGDYIDIRFKNEDNAADDWQGGDITNAYGYIALHYAGCNCEDDEDVAIPTN